MATDRIADDFAAIRAKMKAGLQIAPDDADVWSDGPEWKDATEDDFAAIAAAAKAIQDGPGGGETLLTEQQRCLGNVAQPTADEIRRFVLVYDCAMGCYPTEGTDMWRVRQWLLSLAAQ